MTDHTPLDRALAGEVVKLADERLAEMQQYPYMHPDWPRAITELIAARKEIERLTARVAELEKERDACAEDARATKERLKIAVRGSLNLNNALGRILDVRPLGVETYPECYSIMRTIALNALSAASSSTGATP